MAESDLLARLEAAIAARRGADPASSYVASLNAKGQDHILKKVAEEAVEMLRADPLSAGIDVELRLSETSAYVDPDQIRQILLNLIRNAFAAVGRNGKVRISVEKSGLESRIRVWDSGGQIPQSDLSRIFDPFYTTQKGGTGLGLSITHSIVRAHGGMIQVTSSPERGTEFLVTLPAAQEASVANSGR